MHRLEFIPLENTKTTPEVTFNTYAFKVFDRDANYDLIEALAENNDVDINDSSIIFASSTCYSDNLMKVIKEKCEKKSRQFLTLFCSNKKKSSDDRKKKPNTPKNSKKRKYSIL